MSVTELPAAVHRGATLHAVLRNFASDNYAGAHPEVIDALAHANDGTRRRPHDHRAAASAAF